MIKNNKFRKKRLEIKGAMMKHLDRQGEVARIQQALNEAKLREKDAWDAVVALANEYSGMLGIKRRDGEEGQEEYGWDTPRRTVKTRLEYFGSSAQHVVGKRRSERLGMRCDLKHAVLIFRHKYRKFRLTKSGEVARNFDGEMIKPQELIIPIPK